MNQVLVLYRIESECWCGENSELSTAPEWNAFNLVVPDPDRKEVLWMDVVSHLRSMSLPGQARAVGAWADNHAAHAHVTAKVSHTSTCTCILQTHAHVHCKQHAISHVSEHVFARITLLSPLYALNSHDTTLHITYHTPHYTYPVPRQLRVRRRAVHGNV